MSIEVIEDFCKWFNEARRKDIKPLNHHRYFYNVMQSFQEQFVSPTHRNYLGVSQLYYDSLLLGLQKLGFPNPDDKGISVRNAVTFHYGDIFEALIFELMRSQGIAVKNEQREVMLNINGQEVYGHIDGEVNRTLVEVKTMSDDYFKKFTKEPNNIRGYLTQLGFYFHLLTETDDACWICYNKQTNLLKIVTADPEQLAAYYKMGVEKLQRLAATTDCNSLLENSNIPQPKKEVYKNEETGKYMPPKSLQGTYLLEAFYGTYEAKNGYGKLRTYVNPEPRPKEEIITKLEEIKNGL
jgi:hypothetical protein